LKGSKNLLTYSGGKKVGADDINYEYKKSIEMKVPNGKLMTNSNIITTLTLDMHFTCF